MASSEQTYFVRVRPDEGDAVVEDLRSRRRVHVSDVSAVAAVIASGLRASRQYVDQSRGGNMGKICLTLPLLPDRGGRARAFLRELDHGRREAYDRSERRLGITKEVWFAASVGDQKVIVAYIEADDFAAATERFSASREPFDLWFKDELCQATGVDLNDPPELSLPELLSSYSAEEGDGSARGDREQELVP